jgi:hypothetical protein
MELSTGDTPGGDRSNCLLEGQCHTVFVEFAEIVGDDAGFVQLGQQLRTAGGKLLIGLAAHRQGSFLGVARVVLADGAEAIRFES